MHNEELRAVFLAKYYSSCKIQEDEVGGAGLVALRRFSDEDFEKGDHLEDFGLHFSILSQILKKWDESAGLMWLRIGTSGGFT
jgi:hypothetical protein